MDHKKLWKPILNGADMAIWSWQIFYIIFIIFVPVHQFLIFIVKCFYANNFLSRKNMLLKLFNVINQQFCPKIYQDWDENASNLEEVRKNYGDVKKEMKVLLTLFAVENILLCTPMIMLSVKIYERNKYLDEFFHDVNFNRQLTHFGMIDFQDEIVIIANGTAIDLRQRPTQVPNIRPGSANVALSPRMRSALWYSSSTIGVAVRATTSISARRCARSSVRPVGLWKVGVR